MSKSRARDKLNGIMQAKAFTPEPLAPINSVMRDKLNAAITGNENR